MKYDDPCCLCRKCAGDVLGYSSLYRERQVLVYILLQEKNVKLYPVGDARKKLSLAEAKLPIKEKCLAIVWGIRHFMLYLAGKRFTL